MPWLPIRYLAGGKLEMKPGRFCRISVSAYPSQWKALLGVRIAGLPELISSAPLASYLNIVPDTPVAVCL